MTLFKTDRLTLRVMVDEDAPFYLEMLNDPDFKRNIADRGLNTVEDALNDMRERVFPSYEAHGFGMFLVCQEPDGKSIGMAGLVKRDFLDDVDVGYGFLPRGRGQGFAVEAVSACIDYAGREQGISRLAAITAPDNIASIQVLEKLDFRYAGQLQFPDGGDICSHYLLDL